MQRAAHENDSAGPRLLGEHASQHEPGGMKEERYYTAYGQASDALLRCKDCKRLVTHAQLAVRGCCPSCGTRKVSEITTLSVWEWLKVRTGWIDFPYRQQFLKEFSTR